MPPSLATLGCALLLVCAGINRALFFAETLDRLREERNNDAYVLVHMCDAVDYRKIGRHALICEEIEHRLRTPLVAQALKRVVDETLYGRIAPEALAQLALIAALVAAAAALQRCLQASTLAGAGETFPTLPLSLLPLQRSLPAGHFAGLKRD